LDIYFLLLRGSETETLAKARGLQAASTSATSVIPNVQELPGGEAA